MAEEDVKDKEAKPLEGDVSIHCFVCGNKVSVKGKIPGKTADCDKCKTTLTVPDEEVLKKLKNLESFMEISSDKSALSDEGKDEPSDKSDSPKENELSDKSDKKKSSDKSDTKEKEEPQDKSEKEQSTKSPETEEKKEKPPHKIFCEGCGAKIDVTDQPVGSRFSCPACGMVLKVPKRPGSSQDPKEQSSDKSNKEKSSDKSEKENTKETTGKSEKSKKDSAAPPGEKLKINCHTCGAKIDVTDQEPFKEVNCPACNARFQIPKRFNHFLLEERLGENENFSVYRALDLTLSREVCLKVMSRKLCKNTKMVDTFLEGAGKTALVNDPNIVPIYSSGDDDGQSFLVMQYMLL